MKGVSLKEVMLDLVPTTYSLRNVIGYRTFVCADCGNERSERSEYGGTIIERCPACVLKYLDDISRDCAEIEETLA